MGLSENTGGSPMQPGDNMIYVCAKCKFLFERKNEPSKCPSCENQCVMTANKAERQAFTELHGSQKDAEKSHAPSFSET
jgi:DNA-directed RNA polymerase subunit RPC12/RpoP